MYNSLFIIILLCLPVSEKKWYTFSKYVKWVMLGAISSKWFIQVNKSIWDWYLWTMKLCVSMAIGFYTMPWCKGSNASVSGKMNTLDCNQTLNPESKHMLMFAFTEKVQDTTLTTATTTACRKKYLVLASYCKKERKKDEQTEGKIEKKQDKRKK